MALIATFSLSLQQKAFTFKCALLLLQEKNKERKKKEQQQPNSSQTDSRCPIQVADFLLSTFHTFTPCWHVAQWKVELSLAWLSIWIFFPLKWLCAIAAAAAVAEHTQLSAKSFPACVVVFHGDPINMPINALIALSPDARTSPIAGCNVAATAFLSFFLFLYAEEEGSARRTRAFAFGSGSVIARWSRWLNRRKQCSHTRVCTHVSFTLAQISQFSTYSLRLQSF